MPIWTACESKGPKRSRHAVVSVPELSSVYSFGGLSYDNVEGDIKIHVYNTDTQKWAEVKSKAREGVKDATAPTDRYDHIAVVHEKKVYVWGGQSQAGTASNDIWCFDLEKQEWSCVAVKGTAPATRYGHAACVIKDTIYIYGGVSSNGDTSGPLVAFNITTSTWSDVQAKGTTAPSRQYHSATAVGDKIYVFGGVDDEASRLQVFNVSSQTWETPPSGEDTPSDRGGHCAFAYGGDFYIFGGFSEQDIKFYNDLRKFSPVYNQWIVVPARGSPPSPRGSQSCAVISNTVYIFGGSNNDQYCSNEMFSLELDILDANDKPATTEEKVEAKVEQKEPDVKAGTVVPVVVVSEAPPDEPKEKKDTEEKATPKPEEQPTKSEDKKMDSVLKELKDKQKPEETPPAAEATKPTETKQEETKQEQKKEETKIKEEAKEAIVVNEVVKQDKQDATKAPEPKKEEKPTAEKQQVTPAPEIKEQPKPTTETKDTAPTPDPKQEPKIEEPKPEDKQESKEVKEVIKEVKKEAVVQEKVEETKKTEEAARKEETKEVVETAAVATAAVAAAVQEDKKAEDPTKKEPTKPEPAKQEPAKQEPAKQEPAKQEAAPTEATKTEKEKKEEKPDDLKVTDKPLDQTDAKSETKSAPVTPEPRTKTKFVMRQASEQGVSEGDIPKSIVSQAKKNFTEKGAWSSGDQNGQDDMKRDIPRSIVSKTIGTLAVADPGSNVVKSTKKFYQDNAKESYEMKSGNKGAALVVNMTEVNDNGTVIKRIGSKQDRKTVTKLFQDLGLSVEDHEDLDAKKFNEVLESFVKKADKDGAQSMFIVLMSHGGLKEQSPCILTKDGAKVKVKETLASVLWTGTETVLSGRPKIMIIQSFLEDGPRKSEPEADGTSKETEAPDLQDFYYAYATLSKNQGPKASAGSAYVAELDKVFRKRAATKHVVDLMKEVHENVGVSSGGQGQTSEVLDCLKKPFYVFPGI